MYMNKRGVKIFTVSFATFFLITIVFNRIIPVFEVSSVRPSAALNPVLGLAYGWPAAIGCTLANFLSDIMSGYGIEVAFLGLVPQLIYGILPYYLWNLIVKSVSMRVRLDSPFKVVAYLILMAINAVPIGLSVGAIQQYVTGADFWATASFVALNNFGVCLAFGLPLMVLLDHIYSHFLHSGRRKLSDNEKIILVSSLIQLVIFIFNTIIVYISHRQESNLKKWSEIYSASVFSTGVILLLSIIVMQIRHSNVKRNAGLDIITRKNGTIYVDTKKNIEFVSLPGDCPEYRIKADFLGFKGRKGTDTVSYERGWYTMLSSQRGCLMNCAFCDCPGHGYHGNVNREDFAYQIRTILDTHYISQTQYFQVDFMRMGEPSFNNELLEFIEFDLRNIVRDKIDAEIIVPNVSTMLPKNKKMVERFIFEYCRIKNDVYDGQALLQFSIHSTDDKVRKQLMADRSLNLEEISDIAKKMPMPKGLKYALAFAVGNNLTIDTDEVSRMFDREKFMIKLTPIHATYNAIDNGFDTMNGYSEYSLISGLESRFIKAGWDVMICEDTHEEDEDDLTCGKLLLPVIANDVRKEKPLRKRYGIIAALKYEEDLFRAELSDVKKITLLNKPAYTGILGDNEVIIMQCGMGKVSAGICAQTIIDMYHPDYIINTGCAGALDPELKVGDVVVSDKVVEWDLDLREIGLPLGYIDALGCVEMEASKELADRIMDAKIDDINAKRGIVASGDQFVSKDEQRQVILSNFPGALCAEMEGAAIGHVCLQNDTPFCIIRSMSDTADGASGTDFQTFSEQASRVSASWLIRMLK